MIFTLFFAYKILNEIDTDTDTGDKEFTLFPEICESMNNTSLRDLFNIEAGNSAIASRVIKQTMDAGLIRLYDPKANRKSWKYVPFWA